MTLLARTSQDQARPLAVDGFDRRLIHLVVVGVFVVWIAYFTTEYTSYIVGALSFSVVLYLSMIVALAQRQKHAKPGPYHDRKIAQDEAKITLEALHRLMSEDRLYTDPGLTLSRLARRLEIPAARLSQLLNDNHGTPFKQYLMQIRVEAAKAILIRDDCPPAERVAEECGFVSMSTFYAGFKKAEGVTPAVWRQTQAKP